MQASNYEALKTPHYDYFGDLDTENDTDSEIFQTPRSLSAGYSQRSADTPTRAISDRNQEQDKQTSGYRTPYYFHMPSLSSPMPPRPKSPESVTNDVSKNIKKNTSSEQLQNDKDYRPVSPLKIKLARRVSECGGKDQWNVSAKQDTDTVDSKI